MNGLKSNEVRIDAYDAGWPRLFICEAAELRDALGPLALQIEHIGSTAVPGLAAKPVIDIAIRPATFAELPRVVAAMESLRYVSKGEFGLPGRQFFTKGDPVLFHVHVVEQQSDHWRLWISFRDALRADPELCADYAKLKRDLAVRFAHDRPAYTAAKNEFVNRALNKGRHHGETKNIGA